MRHQPAFEARVRAADLIKANGEVKDGVFAYKVGWSDQNVALAVGSGMNAKSVAYMRKELFPERPIEVQAVLMPRAPLTNHPNDDRTEEKIRSLHGALASAHAKHKTLRDDFEAHVQQDLETISRAKVARTKHNQLCSLLAEVFGDDRFKDCMIEAPHLNGRAKI